MRYAIIENEIVVNIAESNVALFDNWVLADAAEIGDSYINGEFISPEPELEPEPDEPKLETRITKLAFKQRLTQAERISIREAAATNPLVFDFMDILDSATYIDLSRQDTIGGVNAMEVAGLLDEGRADEILTAPVQEHEVFRG